MTAPRISTADLEWLAFRYAADELHGTELSDFEQLLATDERACAAVAQAVLVGQAIVQCEAQRPQQRSETTQVVPMRRRTARLTLVIVASCVASLVVAVGGLNLIRSAPQQATETTTVAALWIQGADDDRAHEDQAHDPLLAMSHEAVDFDEEDAVPGWLLAAITAEQRATDGEEVMQD